MEQQKNKLLVDKTAPDLNGMLCCHFLVFRFAVTTLLWNSTRTRSILTYISKSYIYQVWIFSTLDLIYFNVLHSYFIHSFIMFYIQLVPWYLRGILMFLCSELRKMFHVPFVYNSLFFYYVIKILYFILSIQVCIVSAVIHRHKLFE